MLKKILKISNVKTNVAKNEEKKDNENKDVNREQKVKTDIAKKEEKKDIEIKIRIMNQKKLMIHM